MDAWQGVSGRFVIRGCALPRHAAITTWWQVCRPRTIGVFITKDPPCRPSTCGLREGGSKRRKRHELSPPACGKNEQPKNLKQKSSDDTPARGYFLLRVVFKTEDFRRRSNRLTSGNLHQKPLSKIPPRPPGFSNGFFTNLPTTPFPDLDPALSGASPRIRAGVVATDRQVS